MRILSIETSCDETAIAIVDVAEVNGQKTFTILADETLSQVAMHREYGGVFPMVAKREHAKALVPLLYTILVKIGFLEKALPPNIDAIRHIEQFLSREGEMFKAFTEKFFEIKNPGIDHIVVTQGPGLEPALWVGINFAQALGVLWGVPVVPVNHMEGHILAGAFSQHGVTGSFPMIDFPAVALLISGGHTELVRVDGWGKYHLLGETKDDAVGECFDKVARMLGLPYPGGPEISKLAAQGTPKIYSLPRPMIHSRDLSFSFSGLKTAVLYLVKELGELTEEIKQNIAREFEEAVTEVLVEKTRAALEGQNAQTLIIGGGVSANTQIRQSLTNLCEHQGIKIYLPNQTLSTDNALMIALAGSFREPQKVPLRAIGNWKVHTV